MSPSSWLTAHEELLPTPAAARVALDVACGRGRHALWLAERGFEVHAIDRDARALEELDETARTRGLRVLTCQQDLETGSAGLGVDRFDLIVVVHYLHRPLIRDLIAALRPGGLLIYETFTRAQAARGKPTSPRFLLEPAELRGLVAPLEIVVEREGEFEGRCIASVIARRPAAPSAVG